MLEIEQRNDRLCAVNYLIMNALDNQLDYIALKLDFTLKNEIYKKYLGEFFWESYDKYTDEIHYKISIVGLLEFIREFKKTKKRMDKIHKKYYGKEKR